jgi:hypothetical protein
VDLESFWQAYALATSNIHFLLAGVTWLWFKLQATIGRQQLGSWLNEGYF